MAAAPRARVSVTAEVVGTGSDGTEPSILFSVQRHGVYSSDVTLLKRYLFNCGEGTQRLCGENGVKLSSLDSMFFTRFDVQSVSGVPGMIFSLSTCGAATLRLHGPVGLSAFLTAIQSFVRRKYPRITCVETADTHDDSARLQPHDGPDDRMAFDHETWQAATDQSDQHMRIFAVPLHACSGATRTHSSDAQSATSSCLLCKHGDTVPAPVVRTAAANSAQPGATRDGTDAPFRAWLVRFYTAKVPEKLPYIDVIISRYRGRLDDLKAQLCAKYGDLDTDDPHAHDASSSSCSSDSDDSEVSSATTDFDALPFSREWLVRFYRQHQPEKLLHVDRVLKQFSGREDALKSMLLLKYAPSASNGATEEEPVSKRQKLDSSASPAAAAAVAVVGDAAAPCTRDEPSAVFTEPHVDDEGAPASIASAPPPLSSLCYVMKFLHDVHAVVWIIDCRDASHIDDLIAHFRPGCHSHAPVLVVHFSPVHVVVDARYQAWIQGHGTAQQLLFDCDTLQRVDKGVFSWVFRASAAHTLALQEAQHLTFGSDHATQLWRDLAAYLGDHKSADPTNSDRRRQRRILWRLCPDSSSSADPTVVHIAQSKQRVALVRSDSNSGSSSGSGATFCYERTGWRLAETEAEASSAENNGQSPLRDACASRIPDAPVPVNALRLVVLGTGSAAPSRLRGSTAMYLELTASAAAPQASRSSGACSAPDAMLIDCGEGTYGQLWRQFGSATAARIGALRCVWVSHSHADHQCGLVRILYEYVRYHAAQPPRPLVVIAPQSVLTYAQSWMPHIERACGGNRSSSSSSVCDAPQFVRFATCRELNQSHHDVRRVLLTQIGHVVRSIASVPVWHCYDAYGLVLELQSGAKIVYSGDTRPCKQLIAAGMDATLLIHEATFDDSMSDDAVKKKHCTVGEALDVARQMRAHDVVLTHFSQRYPKLPPPLASAVESGAGRASASRAPRVLCAFDGFVHHVHEESRD